ncbi:MAG: hypothetical protein KBS85_03275 [Lachnospiraceae bacterium]|nr:hypothetical protein [Candidatus Merdinaster equi]
MSMISQSVNDSIKSAYGINSAMKNSNPIQNTQKDSVSDLQQKYGKVSGRTFGNAKLSEKAASYYDELKKKFSNLDFVLVANDSVDQASAMGGALGNKGKTTVLIDVDKIERMAEDEDFRKQYESVIDKGSKQLESMASRLVDDDSIASYGMIVGENGETSFFAVIDKSLQAQRERIDAKREEKREAKREADKEAAKDRLEEKISQNAEDRRTLYNQNRLRKAYETGNGKNPGKSDEVYVSASSLDELFDKLKEQGVVFSENGEKSMTDNSNLGKNFDVKF